jgi:methylphosphotriester-DNA--protein-cysteine methyltransferase
MYETKKDKEYLIKSVNKSIDLINKHLHNIPPAKEIAQNGIAISDMAQRLMEKVEELTLYVIQQQKEIEKLKQQLKKEGK